MPDGMPPPARNRPARGLVFNLANAVTFARLCAVPAIVWLVLHDDDAAAFWLFLAAGLSDALDGWLARRSGPTPVGAMLDPAADKLLLVALYVTLAAERVLPDWLAILVVFRDILIVGGLAVLRLTGQVVAIRPSRLSKANTALQIVGVGAALAEAASGWPGPAVLTALVWGVAASTLASGAAYVWAVGAHGR